MGRSRLLYPCLAGVLLAVPSQICTLMSARQPPNDRLQPDDRFHILQQNNELRWRDHDSSHSDHRDLSCNHISYQDPPRAGWKPKYRSCCKRIFCSGAAASSQMEWPPIKAATPRKKKATQTPRVSSLPVPRPSGCNWTLHDQRLRKCNSAAGP